MTLTNAALIEMRASDQTQDVITCKSASEIVSTARYAFNCGKTKSINFRKHQLKQLKLLLEENSDMIENALFRDFQRHPIESIMFETTLVIFEIERALMNIEDWVKPEKPSLPVQNFFDKLVIHHDPYGVVLIISSWNFPINILFTPLVGAIAPGNCAILKPSEVARNCERVVAKLVPKYLDEECFQVYTGGIDRIKELLAERFDYIFFTGSTFVGRIIHQAANRYLTPVTLELGGKCPVYIDDTVDLYIAVQRIIWAKCTNAGQICIAPDYILCTQELQPKFVMLAKKVIKEFYGNDIISNPDYCRIINTSHFKRLAKFLYNKENIAMGGRVNENQRFIEPTILINIDADSPVMQEEIFGPILPLITVKNHMEAISYIKKGEKPLTLHLFTRNKEVKDLFINQTSSGMISINDTYSSFLIDKFPFGGVGFSGMGSYHAKFSYDTFVHKKGVFETNLIYLINKLISFRYPPYLERKMKWLMKIVRPRSIEISQSYKVILIFFSSIIFGLLTVFMFKLL